MSAPKPPTEKVPPATVRLCRDCKWCDHGVRATPPPGYPETSAALHWKCFQRGGGYLDIISGNMVYPNGARSCHDMRKDTGECTPAGKLFEREGCAPSP